MSSFYRISLYDGMRDVIDHIAKVHGEAFLTILEKAHLDYIACISKHVDPELVRNLAPGELEIFLEARERAENMPGEDFLEGLKTLHDEEIERRGVILERIKEKGRKMDKERGSP